ncbi:MAG: hypothetical protein AB7P03_20185 [Kofleriaceae bacterium]
MPHSLGLRTMFGLASLALVPAMGTGCDKDQLTGPAAEVTKNKEKPALPPVPSFDLPPPSSDGSHAVRELRVNGHKVLGQEITIKGVVTWAYDCKVALRTPELNDDQVQKIIDEDPTKCERAKFYVGDTADTPPEKSAWVVDVPRPYNKLEMERIKKKDRTLAMYPDRCEPNEKPEKTICPPYAQGDQVEVTGTWSLASPHSERNSDGLLVYKRMKNITKGWESPPADPSAAPTGAAAPGARPSPQDLVDQHKRR